jgi:hypothetical protein
MSELTLPWEGGCRCGAVRFAVSAPPLMTFACHCTGCQRMTASAFSLSVLVPDQGFQVTKGEPVIGGLHGENLHHHCCGYCMSWMFTRSERLAGFVNLRATMLDDPQWFAPFMETYTSEKLPWATTPAIHSFQKFPSMEAFPALLKDYAAWAQAPAADS